MSINTNALIELTSWRLSNRRVNRMAFNSNDHLQVLERCLKGEQKQLLAIAPSLIREILMLNRLQVLCKRVFSPHLRKVLRPHCVHYHITCSWSVFGNPICVHSSSLQYGMSLQPLYSKIHAGWHHNWTPRYPGGHHTLPCCCPTAATAPPPPAHLFPLSPVTLAWPRATTNPLPCPLATGLLGPGAESAGALLSTSVDAISSVKQAKLVTVASSIKFIMRHT